MLSERLLALTKLPEITVKRAENEVRDSKRRMKAIVKNVENQRTTALGSYAPKVSLLDSPHWSNALKSVAADVEMIGDTYGGTIASQPDKDGIDNALSNILLEFEGAYAHNSSPSGAAAAQKSAKVAIANMGRMLEGRKRTAMAHTLEAIVQEKNIDRLNVLSALKMNGEVLTENEIKVITMHEAQTQGILDRISSDPANYDSSVLNSNLSLFDKAMVPLIQLRDSVQYRASLSGGKFFTPRRPSSKMYGFGAIPRRGYGQHQGDLGGARHPFVSAPKSRGLGGLIDNFAAQHQAGHDVDASQLLQQYQNRPVMPSSAPMQTIERPMVPHRPTTSRPAQMTVPSIDSIASGEAVYVPPVTQPASSSLLNQSIAIAQAQQTQTSTEDIANLYAEMNNITPQEFGGDIREYNRAMSHYDSQIEALNSEPVIYRHQMAEMVPVESESKAKKDWRKLESWASRAATTVGIGGVAIAVTALYIGYRVNSNKKKTSSDGVM